MGAAAEELDELDELELDGRDEIDLSNRDAEVAAAERDLWLEEAAELDLWLEEAAELAAAELDLWLEEAAELAAAEVAAAELPRFLAAVDDCGALRLFVSSSSDSYGSV